MKVTNYRLNTEIENIKEDNLDWFKSYIREVLESNKPYHSKADYIGLSIKELQNKIDYLGEDIKELQEYKKKLTLAKELVLESIASVLSEYGIDRLDGTLVSSITISPSKTEVKDTLKILDEQELINRGYLKVVLDEEAVKEAMKSLEDMNEIDELV